MYSQKQQMVTSPCRHILLTPSEFCVSCVKNKHCCVNRDNQVCGLALEMISCTKTMNRNLMCDSNVRTLTHLQRQRYGDIAPDGQRGSLGNSPRRGQKKEKSGGDQRQETGAGGEIKERRLSSSCSLQSLSQPEGSSDNRN